MKHLISFLTLAALSLGVTAQTAQEPFVRRSVVEEFTGTWCGHCPRGIVGMERLSEDFGDRFIGIASVDPLVPDAADELERAFTDLGLRGLHLHLGRSHIWPNDERLQPLFDICEAYNRPIIFNAGMSWEPGSLAKYGRPIEYEELAATRPSLRMCLSRFGWPWAGECAMLMVKYPNVYTDTGILYFDSAREFFDRLFKHEVALTWVDRSLRHQVMFGSNNPRFEQIRMAQALDGLGLRESTVELIKGGNAIDFLGGLD